MHYGLTVLLPGWITTYEQVQEETERALAPFEEDLKMDRYVRYTREQAIAEQRKLIADYAMYGPYAEYLADPQAYIKAHDGSHLDYIIGSARDGGFPARLTWSDEQAYQHFCEHEVWAGADDIGPNGEIFSTTNPQGKWDYYQVGHTGFWEKLPDDQCVHLPLVGGPVMDENRHSIIRIGDIYRPDSGLIPHTYALLDLDGTWYDRDAIHMPDAGPCQRWSWKRPPSFHDDLTAKWAILYSELVSENTPDTWAVCLNMHR